MCIFVDSMWTVAFHYQKSCLLKKMLCKSLFACSHWFFFYQHESIQVVKKTSAYYSLSLYALAFYETRLEMILVCAPDIFKLLDEVDKLLIQFIFFYLTQCLWETLGFTGSLLQGLCETDWACLLGLFQMHCTNKMICLFLSLVSKTWF